MTGLFKDGRNALAFTVWLKRVFLPGRVPGVEFSNLNDLQEVQSMLAERVIEWT